MRATWPTDPLILLLLNATNLVKLRAEPEILCARPCPLPWGPILILHQQLQLPGFREICDAVPLQGKKGL
jgi:hypothetical protein